MKFKLFTILIIFTFIQESYSQKETPMKSFMESKILAGGMDGLGNLYGIAIGYGQNIGREFVLKPNILVLSGGEKDPNIQNAKAIRTENGLERTAQLFGIGLLLQKSLNVDKNASLSLGLGFRYFKIFSTNYREEIIEKNNQYLRYLVPIFVSYSSIGPEVELQYKHQITERFGVLATTSFTSAEYVVNFGLGIDVKF